MNYLLTISSTLEILLLLYAAAIDVAARLIYNEVCVVLALVGLVTLLAGSPTAALESLLAAAILFLLLLVLYSRALMGGGDVKLLVALTIGLPLAHVPLLLMVTAVAGGVLAAVHLLMRHLPAPSPAPPGSSLLRRVYAVERWRHSRRAPLPYGAAIACGGIWTIFSRGF